MDRSFVEANRQQLDRMRSIVERATDEDLRTPMPGGWTVASMFGHIVYWDQRVLVLLDQLDRGIEPPPYDELSVDWINDTAKRFLLAMEPRTLARLAVEIAEETDRRVAELPDERVREASERWFTPLRADGRREHLDEVERALGWVSEGRSA